MNIEQMKELLSKGDLLMGEDGARGSIEIPRMVMAEAGINIEDDVFTVTFDRAWKNTPMWKNGGVWWNKEVMPVQATHQEVRLMVMGITGGVENHHYFQSKEYSNYADVA